MRSNHLQTRDLINVGIFTAIYFVIFFSCGMLGFIPVLFILFPLYLPIVTGVPFMLFLTRVGRFGMVTLMALMLGVIMFATGHTWVPVLTAALCGIIADLILKAGNYRSFTHSAIGYGVFSIWSMGAMLPMWIMRDSYFDYIRNSMGDEYTNAVLALTPDWVAYAVVAVAFIAGVAGAFCGRGVLNKHFQRAGIGG
jgi:energy-coupling factor transport system substrate-specific component